MQCCLLIKQKELKTFLFLLRNLAWSFRTKRRKTYLICRKVWKSIYQHCLFLVSTVLDMISISSNLILFLFLSTKKVGAPRNQKNKSIHIFQVWKRSNYGYTELHRRPHQPGFFLAYDTSETKGFFPYDWFDCPSKLDHETLPPYNAFFNKLRNHNPLEADYIRFEKLLFSGHTKQEALIELKMYTAPHINRKLQLEIWRSENMRTFKDFLKWYNNKDVVPTLGAL